MNVLGVHDGKDAGVCLTADGKPVYAANEERFSRKKLHFGFPYLSLANLLETTGIKAHEIDRVSVGFQAMVETEDYPIYDDINDTNIFQTIFAGATRLFGPVTATRAFVKASQQALSLISKNKQGLQKALADHRIIAPIKYIDHHRSHAASAYYTSGFQDALIVTADGGGDGLAGSVYTGRNGKLSVLSEWPRVHSPGNFWFLITYICGFNPIKHGGKITGLAAYTVCEEAHQVLSEFYGYDPNRLSFVNKKHLLFGDAYHALAKALEKFDMQQIAYGAQKVLEETMCGVIQAAVKRTGLSKVALAGGTFANVRLNQKILELDGVEEIFIHPHMGDGGITIGSALDVTATEQGLMPEAITDAYWGNATTDRVIEETLAEYPVQFEKLNDPSEAIADCLVQKQVLGLFNGRMEYGPRALGHRTIMAEPTDPTMMDWLNKRLERTEFMPFAPIILEEDAPQYFENFDAGRLASRFMTLCFNVTDYGKKMAPGIVHKDGTARPQIVNATHNTYVYNALKAYKAKSGLALGINTSFNKHEEPIVCHPRDAVQELLRGGVDVLFLENYQVQKPS
jgi:carbamoyltransferase